MHSNIVCMTISLNNTWQLLSLNNTWQLFIIFLQKLSSIIYVYIIKEHTYPLPEHKMHRETHTPTMQL